MSIKYSVNIEKYAERHFIKSFEKKYRRAWDVTIDALIREFQSFDVLLSQSIAEMITETSSIKICKVEFKIAGTNKSRKSSGNRCIVAVHKDISLVNVLLVYHKNDLGGGNETAKWKQIVKNNYSDYRELLLRINKRFGRKATTRSDLLLPDLPALLASLSRSGPARQVLRYGQNNVRPLHIDLIRRFLTT